MRLLLLLWLCLVLCPLGASNLVDSAKAQFQVAPSHHHNHSNHHHRHHHIIIIIITDIITIIIIIITVIIITIPITTIPITTIPITTKRCADSIDSQKESLTDSQNDGQDNTILL
jgi:flagellar biosynthesis protein FlhB